MEVLPSIGLSTSMIREALSENTNNVGELCTSDKINKWSKWKPVRYSSVKPITLLQIESTNYAIEFPIYSSVSNLIDAIYLLPTPGDPETKPLWNYLKPLGGVSSQCRIGDFRNYKRNSVIPFGLFNVTSRASKTGGSPLIIGTIGFVQANDYQLGLEDFNFENRYFAMAYRKGASGEIKIVRAGAGEFSVELDVNDENLTTGDYQAFLFMTDTSGGYSGGIIGFEGHPTSLIFEVVTQTVTLRVEARYDLFNENNVIIDVIANNETGGAVSLPLCLLQIRNSVNECSSTIQENEVSKSIGTISAPSGTSTIYSTTETISRDFYPMWKICWSNAGLYPNEFSTNIIQEM